MRHKIKIIKHLEQLLLSHANEKEFEIKEKVFETIKSKQAWDDIEL